MELTKMRQDASVRRKASGVSINNNYKKKHETTSTEPFFNASYGILHIFSHLIILNGPSCRQFHSTSLNPLKIIFCVFLKTLSLKALSSRNKVVGYFVKYENVTVG